MSAATPDVRSHRTRVPGDTPVGRFRVDHAHGAARGRRISPGLPALEPADLLFLDTETTGLRFDQNDWAYLVGFAAFDGEALVVEQLVACGPDAEAELLRKTAARIARRPALVTFNGCGFDLPLLRARMMRHGIDASGLDRPHFDLLKLARVLLRGRGMPNFRLATVETRVLGLRRENDLPGSEAPARYQQYLASADYGRLHEVIEHNRWDLMSLAPIIGILAAAAEGEPDEPNRPLRAVAKARARAPGPARRAGSTRDGGSTETGAARPVPDDSRVASPELDAVAMRSVWQALRDRVAEARRAGDVDAALQTLNEMTRLPSTDPLPHVQLARIYEHELGEPDRALEHAKIAARLAPWDSGLRAQLARLNVAASRRV